MNLSLAHLLYDKPSRDLSEKEYYPFGMVMPERNFSSDNYRFGFNSQEKDDEIKGSGNSLSFTYRIHDPRLGRFLSIDPLFASYPWNSPYSFAENKVIQFIELEGAEITLPRIGYWTIPRPIFVIPRGPTAPVPPVIPPIALPRPNLPSIPLPKTIPLPPSGITEGLNSDDIDLSNPGAIKFPKADIEMAWKQKYDPIGPLDDANWTGGYKNKVAPKGGKSKNDIPDFAEGHAPRVGESGKDFSKRLLDRWYGNGKWEGTGPGSEFSKVKKWGDTHFKDVVPLSIKDFIKFQNEIKLYKQDLKGYEKELNKYYKAHPELSN